MSEKQNFVSSTISDIKEFAHDSRRLLNRCSKPDKKEYVRIAGACAVGFAVMGFIGFFVKLVFIPINNILLTPS
ncbi:hypothetical protein SteCoe_22163 [Stentor coeruleus]|uniref:Uncharacterized protein n=1 Tax=Stentor coeruleus TaxID=5963 RepID=A0A1R2BMV7_9CILI|nr:hypothetical protein SteCoe_35996 [Stentor coeruleus]OMJ78098.1 hypothetical protein SteCoe_22163 [Stentor coeruleus]